MRLFFGFLIVTDDNAMIQIIQQVLLNLNLLITTIYYIFCKNLSIKIINLTLFTIKMKIPYCQSSKSSNRFVNEDISNVTV